MKITDIETVPYSIPYGTPLRFASGGVSGCQAQRRHCSLARTRPSGASGRRHVSALQLEHLTWLVSFLTWVARRCGRQVAGSPQVLRAKPQVSFASALSSGRPTVIERMR